MKKFKQIIEYNKIIIILAFFLIVTRFKCLFKSFTGFPCPSCGLTRACKSFFNFDFKKAFYYHPLFFFIPPLFLFLIYANKPLFKSKYKQNAFLVICLIIILTVYLYRMIYLFPHTAPMDYNKASFLYKLFSSIHSLII